LDFSENLFFIYIVKGIAKSHQTCQKLDKRSLIKIDASRSRVGRINELPFVGAAWRQVTVTNVETNAVRRTRSNELGYFEVTLLDPGSYTVAVEADGFPEAAQLERHMVRTEGRITVSYKEGIGIPAGPNEGEGGNGMHVPMHEII
jgi:hypothetical protein